MTAHYTQTSGDHADGRDQVRLVARADTALTELVVYDGRFCEVARGYGRIRQALPRGLYKVEFRAGNQAVRRYAALTGEHSEVTVSIGPDDLQLSSAAPIQVAGAHQVEAVQLSHSATAVPADRAQLMLFAHDPDPARGVGDCPRMLAGFTLHGPDGKLVADLDRQVESGPGWAGALLDLAPGSYRLRVPSVSGRVFEQAVAACPGWQIQMFLDCHGRADDRAASLFDASVYLAPASRGFDPTRHDLRLVEQARRGLADGRDVLTRVLPVSTRRADRWLKFAADEPMLGLMAIHLLRRRLTPERERGLIGAAVRKVIREVARVIREVLGDQPDLRAIEAWLDPDVPLLSCDAPPMLLDSWRAARDASDHRAEVMDPDNLAARITGRIWGPGPWLIWEYARALDAPRPDRPQPVAVRPDALSLALTLVAEALTSRRDDPRMSVVQLARGRSLNRLEAELLGYLWEFVLSQFARLRRAAATPGRPDSDPDGNGGTPPAKPMLDVTDKIERRYTFIGRC